MQDQAWRQLEALLCEDRSAVAARERAAADLLAGAGARPIVLFGAGNLGRKLLAGLREIGLPCIAFSDNSPSLWGTTVEGLMVLPPAEAAQRYGGQAVFVVAIWNGDSGHRFPLTREQLRGLGCKSVMSFMPIFWSYGDRFLPYFAIDLPSRVLDARDDVMRAMALWSDDSARCEYAAQVRWRLWADFDALSLPVAGEEYFPADLFALTADDVLADCGAFDGDTIRCVVERLHLPFRLLHAFEPDPRSFGALQQSVASLPQQVQRRIVLHDLAASSAWCTASFDASGTPWASLSAAGGERVRCAPLDSVLVDSPPTFIKMDVEGAELSALCGAVQHIRTQRPILAISAYHRQSDLWQVPLLIDSYATGYRFFLRAHQLEGFGLVCYAVPQHRLLARANAADRAGAL